jgi:hypothetical protein
MGPAVHLEERALDPPNRMNLPHRKVFDICSLIGI